MKQLIFSILFMLTLQVKAQINSINPEFAKKVNKLKKQNKLNFLNEVESRNFIGVEILIIAPGRDNLESNYGHAALRFIDTDEDPFNDVTINFKMLALSENKKDYFKAGVIGSWEFIPKYDTFNELLRIYLRKEMRGITRYVLPSNEVLIESLIEVIKLVIDLPNTIGNYNYVLNNCFDALLKVIDFAGYPILDLNRLAKPEDSDTILSKLFLTVLPKIEIKDRINDLFDIGNEKFKLELINSIELSKMNKHTVNSDEVLRIANAMTEGYNKIVKKFYPNYKSEYSLADAEEDINFWLKNLDIKDQNQLLHLWPLKWPPNLKNLINKIISTNKSRLSLSETIDYIMLPENIYKLCGKDDSDCFEKRLCDIQNIWEIQLNKKSIEKDKHLIAQFNFDYETRFNQYKEKLKNKIIKKETSFNYKDIINDAINDFLPIGSFIDNKPKEFEIYNFKVITEEARKEFYDDMINLSHHLEIIYKE